MKEYKLGDLPESSLHIYGRNSGILDPLTLFWTASGVEVCVKASELWVEVDPVFKGNTTDEILK